jgi:hypothetical protein
MTNVVQFPAASPLVYVCSCGCQSFRIYASGMIECANCGEDHQRHADGTPVGGWVKTLPDTPDVAAIERDEGGTIVVKATGAADFASASVLQKLTKWTKRGSIAALFGFDNDGSGSHWTDVCTEDQKQWVLRKLRELNQLHITNESE